MSFLTNSKYVLNISKNYKSFNQSISIRNLITKAIYFPSLIWHDKQLFSYRLVLKAFSVQLHSVQNLISYSGHLLSCKSAKSENHWDCRLLILSLSTSCINVSDINLFDYEIFSLSLKVRSAQKPLQLYPIPHWSLLIYLKKFFTLSAERLLWVLEWKSLLEGFIVSDAANWWKCLNEWEAARGERLIWRENRIIAGFYGIISCSYNQSPCAMEIM